MCFALIITVVITVVVVAIVVVVNVDSRDRDDAVTSELPGQQV